MANLLRPPCFAKCIRLYDIRIGITIRRSTTAHALPASRKIGATVYSPWEANRCCPTTLTELPTPHCVSRSIGGMAAAHRLRASYDTKRLSEKHSPNIQSHA